MSSISYRDTHSYHDIDFNDILCSLDGKFLLISQFYLLSKHTFSLRNAFGVHKNLSHNT